ncbi:MAG: hypothetical protein ACON42_04215 [Flavobacteriaceae bacterium]
MVEIEDLIFQKDIFVKGGNKVQNNIERTYVSLYRKVICNHFSVENDENIFLPFKNISNYTRFHLFPLMIDAGIEGKFAMKNLQINENLIFDALSNFKERNMWHTSNIHMGALAAIKFLKSKKLENIAKKTINSLDKNNFNSSKWLYRGSINRVATFYHYLPYIHSQNLEISNSTKDVLYSDIIGLQNSFGSFCSPNGFSCIELDAVVVASYLQLSGYGLRTILKNKLFNHLSNFDSGWPLYGLPYGTHKQLIDITKSPVSIQDKLWNLKKIFFDIKKVQLDNGNQELSSKSYDKTLMSNYFGLVTYLQLLVALKIESKTNIKPIKSFGLSYVIN